MIRFENLSNSRGCLLSKDYSTPEVDPEWNQGVYLPRHCRFWGEYEGVTYDETPILEVPFKEEHKKEFYSIFKELLSGEGKTSGVNYYSDFIYYGYTSRFLLCFFIFICWC